MEKIKLFGGSILDLLYSLNKNFVEVMAWVFVVFTLLFSYALYHQFLWGTLGFTLLYLLLAGFCFYIYFQPKTGDWFSHLFFIEKKSGSLIVL